MTVPDLDRVARLIREVAETEILPRFRRLEEHHTWEKRPGSLVTVADEAAEKRLEDGLLRLAPGSVALGEEAAEKDSSIFERLLDDEPVWIIDPVDGTKNFAAGRPEFAVIVACRGRGNAGRMDPRSCAQPNCDGGGGRGRANR